MLPPPTPPQDIPEARRGFLSALLDVCVRQLAWPANADWEAPTGEEPDPDDDLALLQAKRLVSSLPLFPLMVTDVPHVHRINSSN